MTPDNSQRFKTLGVRNEARILCVAIDPVAETQQLWPEDVNVRLLEPGLKRRKHCECVFAGRAKSAAAVEQYVESRRNLVRCTRESLALPVKAHGEFPGLIEPDGYAVDGHECPGAAGVVVNVAGAPNRGAADPTDWLWEVRPAGELLNALSANPETVGDLLAGEKLIGLKGRWCIGGGHA
jgi:hypothetical protein